MKIYFPFQQVSVAPTCFTEDAMLLQTLCIVHSQIGQDLGLKGNNVFVFESGITHQQRKISMALSKTAVNLVCWQWSYWSLVLSYQYLLPISFIIILLLLFLIINLYIFSSWDMRSELLRFIWLMIPNKLQWAWFAVHQFSAIRLLWSFAHAMKIEILLLELVANFETYEQQINW